MLISGFCVAERNDRTFFGGQIFRAKGHLNRAKPVSISKKLLHTNRMSTMAYQRSGLEAHQHKGERVELRAVFQVIGSSNDDAGKCDDCRTYRKDNLAQQREAV